MGVFFWSRYGLVGTVFQFAAASHHGFIFGAASHVHAQIDRPSATDGSIDDEIHDDLHGRDLFQSSGWSVHLLHYIEHLVDLRTPTRQADNSTAQDLGLD